MDRWSATKAVCDSRRRWSIDIVAANGNAKGMILNTLNAAECGGAGIIQPISIVIAVNIISIAVVVITVVIIDIAVVIAITFVISVVIVIGIAVMIVIGIAGVIVKGIAVVILIGIIVIEYEEARVARFTIPSNP